MLLKVNILVLVFNLTIFYPANTSWEQKYVKDNITVFSREISGSNYIASRAEMVMNTPLNQLVDLINNFNQYPEFIHNCQSAKLINRNNNTYIAYLAFNAPWPLTDRDVYIQLDVEQASDIVEIQIKDIEGYKTQKGFVRIEELHGKWILDQLGKSQVKVVFEIHINPGGSVPAWVVNNSADDQVFYTLRNARNIIK